MNALPYTLIRSTAAVTPVRLLALWNELDLGMHFLHGQISVTHHKCRTYLFSNVAMHVVVTRSVVKVTWLATRIPMSVRARIEVQQAVSVWLSALHRCGLDPIGFTTTLGALASLLAAGAPNIQIEEQSISFASYSNMAA